MFFDFLIKSAVYLLIFRQNSMIFEGSLNSLTESYFTGELRLKSLAKKLNHLVHMKDTEDANP